MTDTTRTTGGGKTPATTYLWPDEAEALNRAAERERVPKAEIIRRALREWLERVKCATIVVLALVGAAGCAATTPYAALEARGGYVETWRSPVELEVRFHHNDYLTVKDARMLALRRAAELALESGFRYVRVWGERLHRPRLAGAQYASLQVLFVERANGGEGEVLDVAEIVALTDELAAGRLSAKARQQLERREAAK